MLKILIIMSRHHRVYTAFVIIMITLLGARGIFAAPMPTDSRIKTIVYTKDEIFQVKFMVGYQAFMEFEKDEKIELISFGDSIPWDVKVIDNRLFIKCLNPAVKTNMTIISNKRTYLFEISSTESTEDQDDSVTFILRFYYPDVNSTMPPAAKATAKLDKAVSINDKVKTLLGKKAANTQLAALNNKNEDSKNYKYSYSGKNTNILPLQVFDNGFQTYFKFKEGTRIPIISAVMPDGKEVGLRIHIVNKTTVMVNTIETQYALRDADSVLCVFNDNLASQYTNQGSQ